MGCGGGRFLRRLAAAQPRVEQIVGALELSQVKIEDFIEEKPDPMEPEGLARVLDKIEKRLEAARNLPEYDRLFASLLLPGRGMKSTIRVFGDYGI